MALSLEEIKNYLRDYDGPAVTLMEICGSHTAAIAKNGIPSLLSDKIRLISGPGCPVCVTPSAYVDRLIELGEDPRNVIVTFGDLLRVPGSRSSLSEAKGRGADVRMVYAPFDVLKMAAAEPDKTFIFAAVGFETTQPVYALLLDRLVGEDVHNVRLLTSLKVMPPVIRYLKENGAAIDGFIAPGHVSVVTGSGVFEELAEETGLPFAVAGFEGPGLLAAICALVKMRGQGRCLNLYPSVVTREGNVEGQALMAKYFEEAPAVWRGMGQIEGSGRLIRPEYEAFDAGSRGLDDDQKINKACCCDKVLMGKMRPYECPLFRKVCSPLSPQGACMVSPEGSCHTAFMV